MKTIFLTVFLGMTGVVLDGAEVGSREARVSVAFLHPESYADLGPSHLGHERAAALRDLGGAMQRCAAQFLRDGLQLDLQVRDIDLAGDVESWRGGAWSGVRIMRDVYPPRMTISFRLRDDRGRVLAQGEVRLSEPNFLFGQQSATEPWRQDKALFHDWVRNEFAEYRR